MEQDPEVTTSTSIAIIAIVPWLLDVDLVLFDHERASYLEVIWEGRILGRVWAGSA